MKTWRVEVGAWFVMEVQAKTHEEAVDQGVAAVRAKYPDADTVQIDQCDEIVSEPTALEQLRTWVVNVRVGDPRLPWDRQSIVVEATTWEDAVSRGMKAARMSDIHADMISLVGARVLQPEESQT